MTRLAHRVIKNDEGQTSRIVARPKWTGKPCHTLLEVDEICDPGLLEVAHTSGHYPPTVRITFRRMYDVVRSEGLLPKTPSLGHLMWLVENAERTRKELPVKIIPGWASVSFIEELEVDLVPIANLHMGCLTWSPLDYKFDASLALVVRNNKNRLASV